MKIQILTEGVSEYKSLPLLYNQLRARTNHDLLSPMKVDVSPDAVPSKIAMSCKSRLIIAARTGAELAVLILDREQQVGCPGALAQSITEALRRTCKMITATVVIKDRSFENWLISDIDALACQPERFKVTPALRRRVEPDKADRPDAIALIKSATVGRSYEKVRDSSLIMRRLDVGRAAAHSRSFRHFLHVIEDREYSAQCRRPQPDS